MKSGLTKIQRILQKSIWDISYFNLNLEELVSLACQIKEKADILDACNKSFNEDMSDIAANDILKIQVLIRKLYIQTFSFSEKLSISKLIPPKEIINSTVSSPTPLFYLIQNSSIIQSIRSGLDYITNHPIHFAQIIISYFTKNPKEYSLFSYLIFPSLFGYFLTDELISMASEILSEIVKASSPQFAQPLLLSFFSLHFNFEMSLKFLNH